MSKSYAWLSPVSGSGIFEKTPRDSFYPRLRQLLSEDRWLPHEKSINGRMKRALNILRAEFSVLPTELKLLHSIVSNSVHVILDNGEKVDYNEFLDNWKGSYPAHAVDIPNNNDNLRLLSECMAVKDLYAGYAKLIQEIIW